MLNRTRSAALSLFTALAVAVGLFAGTSTATAAPTTPAAVHDLVVPAHATSTRFYGTWMCDFGGCAFYIVYVGNDLDSRQCYVRTYNHAHRQFGIAIYDTRSWYVTSFIC